MALGAGIAVAADPTSPDQRLKELESALKQGEAERTEIRQKAAAQAEEVDSIRTEMVSAARAVQEHEENLSELELQLKDLGALETEKMAALDLKRQQLNGVLTALQRLAFRPTEALIAQPTSPADTVRSAILLRDVVPRIQESAKALRADIDSLASLRTDIAQQKQKISAITFKLDGEHRRLASLYQRKTQIQQQTEEQRRGTESRLAAMASEASDLRDLLTRIEQERKQREAEAAERAAAERAAAKAARDAEIAAQKAAHEAEIAAQKAAHEAEVAARKAAKEKHDTEIAAARQAKQAEAEAKRAAAEAEVRAAKAAHQAAEADAANTTVTSQPVALHSFSQAQGAMPFPARGRIAVRFGQTNDLGAPSRGISIETRANAQVIAPYDGQVVFSGPFRGYGLLLIIEHGEGYHTLLAGMARIDSTVGQRLLAGEPVGVMAESEDKPLLYVELRHNGQPVNPLPWLTARKTKVSG
jgi:septal ring factor EnvC (AmiA/AmiB activator)